MKKTRSLSVVEFASCGALGIAAVGSVDVGGLIGHCVGAEERVRVRRGVLHDPHVVRGDGADGSDGGGALRGKANSSGPPFV